MWKRVVAPTALVSLLWLAAGGTTLYYIHWLYQSHARSLDEKLTTIQTADTMQDVLWRLQATVMEVAQQADSHTRIEVADLEDAFETQIAQAQAHSGTPEGEDLVRTIGEEFSRYRELVHRRLAPDVLVSKGELPPIDEMARRAHAVAGSCKRLLEFNQRLISESKTRRNELVAFDLVMVTLWIAGPALGILCGLWVARGLRHSISQISISLTDAAGGLEHELGKLNLLPSDDLPELHQQVQAVSSRIREVVDQLQQARRETMRAERLAAVGELAAGVAHELRNPLTAVKLLIQNAAQRPGGRPLNEQQLRVVQEQLVRMESTIQGLLDFARPPTARRVRHDLRDTVQRALNLVEGRAKQEEVAIRGDFPRAPVLVAGDPEQLHQVFVNLLLNGVESMSEGGGTLQVAVQAADGPGGVCRVTVCDSGTGIPEPIMTRLFEPFVTGKERGTGLGLAISRRIVEQHGGTLTAVNRAGHGAVFTVQLPSSGQDHATSA